MCLSGCSRPSPPSKTSTTSCPFEAFEIKGDEDFKEKTKECLEKINATPTGAKLLQSIKNSGKKIVIKPSSSGNGASPNDASKATRNPDGTPGEGTGSTVRFNPDKESIADGSKDWHNRPACIGFAHELIHANHSANGTNDFTQKGEDMAVGLPPYENEKFTENKIREEWTPKQPKRDEY